jgi:hypothetical protein
LIVVGSVATLVPISISSALESVTELVTLAAASAVTFTRTVMAGKLELAASESVRVQLSGERPHDQPVPEIDVAMRPAGRVSVTVTVPAVAEPPAFWTAIW